MPDGATAPLVRYDAMCQAIAEAHAIDEVKDIMDKALALEIYSRQSRNTENEWRACEIRLRAMRRAGQMSEQLPTVQGHRSDLTSIQPEKKSDLLEAAGITPTMAHRMEKLAAIPQAEFEATFAAPERKPSATGIIAAHQPPKAKSVDDRALWLWGRLLDFERQGLLSSSPSDIFDTMLDHMKEATLELAPLVVAWLERLINDNRK